MKITEKEFKEFCKDCYTPEFYIVLRESYDVPLYLRRYFELIGRKALAKKLKKELTIKDKNKVINSVKKGLESDIKKNADDLNKFLEEKDCKEEFGILTRFYEDLMRKIPELIVNMLDNYNNKLKQKIDELSK